MCDTWDLPEALYVVTDPRSVSVFRSGDKKQTPVPPNFALAMSLSSSREWTDSSVTCGHPSRLT